MYLFIDTTENITIGLLDKKLSWVNYQYIESKKSSAELHILIHDVLGEKNIALKNLDGVIYCAGPGSYTGMRVSGGMTDILSWQGLKVYSFYQFKVPFYANYQNGLWISKAFKGEYFIYSWEDQQNEKYLVKEKDLDNTIEGKNLFSGHLSYDQSIQHLTKDLIFKEPKKIFSKVIDQNLNEELYYYRPLSEEYKRS